MKKIAIIPVRAGSKRFPNKNFSTFCGISLIGNTVQKLLKANVDKIIISSDDVVKAEEAYRIGLEGYDPQVLFYKRPSSLAQDDTKTEDIILDVIHQIDLERMIKPDEDYIVILAQITSPNWSPHRLTYALNKLESKNVPSVISVSPSYKPNGCFYITKMSTFVKYNKLYYSNMYLVKLNWEESIDIDYEYEYNIAQSISKGNHD